SVTIDDLHETSHFFDLEKQIEGAEDYTFPVYHSPDNAEEDTTKITIESNGGQLVLSLVFKNGTIQSVDQKLSNDIVIFPNPVQDQLFIKNAEPNKIDEISVHNIIGKVVLNESYDFGVSQLNLSYLKSGVYFVHLKSSNQVVSVKKIIKQ
ncbi:MAG: T9SS type A sorting domain-containing protein, partial [Pseudomonadales bacterium]|nr:T9SS type A sorting domain-containing protein [Pseudomonadales bacterium]